MSLNDQSALEALQAELDAKLAIRRGLSDLDSHLAKKEALFSGSLFFKLIRHLDGQIDLAKADANVSRLAFDDKFDDENDFIGYRQEFHKSIFKRFISHSVPILVILGFQAIVDFLDSLSWMTILGPFLYPLIGLVAFSLTLSIVLTRRAKLGKTKWPGKRIAKWLVLSGLGSALIAFWPLVSIALAFLGSFDFWPSNWILVLALVFIFIGAVLQALLKYQYKYREYFDKLQVLAAQVKWASEALVRANHELHRLGIQREQVLDWMNILALHSYRPWMLPNASQVDSRWNSLASTLPISVHVGQAIDFNSEAGEWSTQMTRIVESTTESLSQQGWRSQSLENLLKSSDKHREISRSLDWEALDLDSPVTPNGSRAELIRLLENEDFLLHVGESAVQAKRRDIERLLLDAAELKVSDISGESQRRKGLKENEHNWDEFLTLPMGDLSYGSPALAKFAFAQSSQLEGHHSNIESLVFVPKRIAKNLVSSGQQIPEFTRLISATRNEGHEFDLVVRIDIAGMRNPIPLKSLAVASGEDIQLIESQVLATCSNCGSPKCPSLKDSSVRCSSGRV